MSLNIFKNLKLYRDLDPYWEGALKGMSVSPSEEGKVISAAIKRLRWGKAPNDELKVWWEDGYKNYSTIYMGRLYNEEPRFNEQPLKIILSWHISHQSDTAIENAVLNGVVVLDRIYDKDPAVYHYTHNPFIKDLVFEQLYQQIQHEGRQVLANQRPMDTPWNSNIEWDRYRSRADFSRSTKETQLVGWEALRKQMQTVLDQGLKDKRNNIYKVKSSHPWQNF